MVNNNTSNIKNDEPEKIGMSEEEEIKKFSVKWLYFEVIKINKEWAFGVGIVLDNKKNLKIRTVKGRFYKNLVIAGESRTPIPVDLSTYPKEGIKMSRGKEVRVITQIPITQALKFQIKKLEDFLPLIPIIFRQLSKRVDYLENTNASTRKKNMVKKDIKKSIVMDPVFSEIAEIYLEKLKK